MTVAATPASAAPRPLSTYFDEVVVGDFVQAGNALAYCRDGCSHTITAPVQANSSIYMQQLDLDGVASTSNSSASVIAIPDGARVVSAIASWGGYAGTGEFGANSGNGFTPGAHANPVQISVGSNTPSYQTRTPIAGRSSDANNNAVQPTRWYSASADITDMFDGLTGNQTVWVGGVPSWVYAGSNNSTIGWGLTVVYEWPDGFDLGAGHIGKQVQVLEGLFLQTTGSTGNTQTISIPPVTDSNDVYAGIIAVEGDIDVSGDVLLVNGTDIPNRVPEPTTGSTGNFFISSAQGTNLPGANPQWASNQAIDVKRAKVPNGLVPLGATSIQIATRTAGDGFGIFQMAFSVPVGAIDLTKTSTPATYDSVGDVITYSFLLENIGGTTLSDVTVEDPMTGLSALSCPTGANGSIDLAIGASTTCTATYTVTADDIANNRDIGNTAYAYATTPAGTVATSPTAPPPPTASPATRRSRSTRWRPQATTAWATRSRTPTPSRTTAMCRSTTCS